MPGRPIAGYIFLTFLLVSVTIIINAGSTGKIAGIVTDAHTGAPIEGAYVNVAGTEQWVLTGVDGSYELCNVVFGSHAIRVGHKLYQSRYITAIVVISRQTTDHSLELTRKRTLDQKGESSFCRRGQSL